MIRGITPRDRTERGVPRKDPPRVYHSRRRSPTVAITNHLDDGTTLTRIGRDIVQPNNGIGDHARSQRTGTDLNVLALQIPRDPCRSVAVLVLREDVALIDIEHANLVSSL